MADNDFTFDPEKLKAAQGKPSTEFVFDPSKLEAVNAGKPKAEPSKPYQSEPKTVGGEFWGGLEDVGKGFNQVFNFREPREGAVLPIPQAPKWYDIGGGLLRMATGAVRAASSPVSGTLGNVTGKLSEIPAEPFQKIPEEPALTPEQRLYTRDMPFGTMPMEAHPARVIGGATQAALDTAVAGGISKVAPRVSSYLKDKYPTRYEQAATARTGAEAARQEAATNATLMEQRAALQGAESSYNAEKAGAAKIAQAESDLAGVQQRTGLEAAQGAGPTPPKREAFKTRYAAVKKKAATQMVAPVNLNAKAIELTGDTGVVHGLSNPAERTAAATAQRLTEGGDIEQVAEQVRAQVRGMLEQGNNYSPSDYKAIIKQVVGPATTEKSTVEQLIDGRQRLRAAQRAAYDAGHKNLGRQFGILDDAISADIEAADKINKTRIGSSMRAIDKDYFRKKSVDWWKEGLEEGVNPTTGAFDRKRFTRWWSKYVDEDGGTKFLERQLGDNFQPTKDLISDMQSANDMNVEQATKNLVKRIGGETKRSIGDIDKGVEAQIKAIGGGQDAKIKSINADLKKKLDDIGIDPVKAPGKLAGSFMIVGGLHGMGYGVITGNPIMIGSGAASVAGGFFTISHTRTLAKVLNTVHGQSIVRRLMRATPGSVEAATAGNAYVNLADRLSKEEPERPTEAQASTDAGFQEWKKKYAPNDSGADYDLMGAYKAGLKPGENGHFSDEFKKPNHPTFSVESKYWKPGLPAGRWENDNYVKMTAPEAIKFVREHPEVRPGGAQKPTQQAAPKRTIFFDTQGKRYERPFEMPSDNPEFGPAAPVVQYEADALGNLKKK